MPVKIKGATSGDITLTTPAAAGTNTLTLPAVTGTVITSADTGTVTQGMIASGVSGNGPAFAAYQSSAQSALTASTWTKISLQAEDFDTASCFDSTTNYRFTPNVAGYYQITGSLQINGTTSQMLVAIYKNGVQHRIGNYFIGTSFAPTANVCALVFLNGSTDYVELWGNTGTSLATTADKVVTFLHGFLARSA